MMSNMCRCMVLKITQKDELSIELSEPYDGILLKMFPQCNIDYRKPNISYKTEGNNIRFYSDDIHIQFVEQSDFFDIMFVIEEYIQIKYKRIVLHGGAIANNNKAVAIIQSRKKGKSTLLRGLLMRDEYYYIADDFLLLCKDEIAGIASPIRVRKKLEGIIEENGKYIGNMVDETGEIRNIFVPNNTILEGFVKLACIILPTYADSGDNSFIKLSGMEKFLKVLANVKGFESVQSTYEEISYLCNSIPVYELYYSDINYAIEKIALIWN